MMDSRWALIITVLFSFASKAIVKGGNSKECDGTESLQVDPHPDFGETSRSLQAQWIGKDSILVVASSGSSTTNVWLGSKQDTGIFRFTKPQDSINDAVNPESLKISPNKWRTALLVTSDNSKMYVSSDAGKTWSKRNLPQPSSDPMVDILMSKVSPSHLSLSADNGELYISRDLGDHWVKVADSVPVVMFAQQSSKKEFLFFSAKEKGKPVHNLYRIDITDPSLEQKLVLTNIYRFFVDDKYLFVSKVNYTKSNVFQRSRRFYVSKNYFDSKPKFAEVQIPAASWNDAVQVMATHEMGAFIHISTKMDNEKGTLYVSDNSGIRFTVSLKNHLFKRISLFGSSISFNDFYEVNSMRGVYITVNVSTVNETDYHQSVITFNNGGSWQLLTPPADSDCSLSSGCSIHLHATYSILKTYVLSNSTLKTGPLSVNNAIGIIVAHASIGKSRDYDPNKAFIVTSQDGGHSWTKPNIPPGQYNYGIADYGNIIAVAADSKHSESIWFSHDRGVCFIKNPLDTTNYFKLSKGLLMDPSATSLYAFALGLEGNDENDAWRLIAINFGSVLTAPCHEGDYVEADFGGFCSMGYTEKYKIAKAESVCYNDDSYSPAPQEVRCNCSYKDMECAFGYTPSWSSDILKCNPQSGVSLAKDCPPGDKYYYQTKTGLQLIAGDKCKNTTETAKLLSYEQKTCKGHEKESGIDLDQSSHRSRTAGHVIGAIIIVIALMAAAGMTLWCMLKFRKRKEFHDKVVYKKIPLTENGFTSNSDDESDEDLLN